MRTVNIAQLKDHLSAYLTFAKAGETIVVRDRNTPVAKIIPFSATDASDEDMELVALGHMRMPENQVDLHALQMMPKSRETNSCVVQAVLDEREESV